MKNTLVSIILPVYNGEKYIKHSIKSILMQTYKNIELIIVNDCSTDATANIIAEYARLDSRVRVITHETNKRLPAALNTGHRDARGKFLTWTSDDNLYKATAIEKMLKQITTSDGCDIVYADIETIDEHGEFIRYIKKDLSYILPIMNVIGACFLYTKETYDKVGGFDEDLFGVEDYAFWLKCFNCDCSFVHIPQSLYYYRLHSNTLTSQKQAMIHALDIQLIYNNNKKNIHKIPDTIRMRAYLKAAQFAMNNNDRALAHKCYHNALEISPDAPNYTNSLLIDYVKK